MPISDVFGNNDREGISYLFFNTTFTTLKSRKPSLISYVPILFQVLTTLESAGWFALLEGIPTQAQSTEQEQATQDAKDG
jgi:hypothetical protein